RASRTEPRMIRTISRPRPSTQVLRSVSGAAASTSVVGFTAIAFPPLRIPRGFASAAGRRGGSARLDEQRVRGAPDEALVVEEGGEALRRAGAAEERA